MQKYIYTLSSLFDVPSKDFFNLYTQYFHNFSIDFYSQQLIYNKAFIKVISTYLIGLLCPFSGQKSKLGLFLEKTKQLIAFLGVQQQQDNLYPLPFSQQRQNSICVCIINNLQIIKSFTGQQILTPTIVFIQMLHSQNLSSHKQHHATFLHKLIDILQAPELQSIIRWNSKGTAICIVSIGRFQEQILPIYFRHSKYTSFVRQLNIYGFSKCKTERGFVAAFSHPLFVRGFKDIERIHKKNTKQHKNIRKYDQNISSELKKPIQISQEALSLSQKSQCIQIEPVKDISQPFIRNTHKNSYNLQQQKVGNEKSYKIAPQTQFIKQEESPSITELIEQIQAKISNYDFQIDILKSIEIQTLLKEKRYQKVRSIYQDRCIIDPQYQSSNNWQIQPMLDFTAWKMQEYTYDKVNSEEMQFII